MSYMLLLILSKTGILENINNVFQLRFHRPICMMYHEAQDRKALQIRLTREGARNVYLHQLCIPFLFQKQQAVNAIKDARDQYNRMCSTDTDWITSRTILDVQRSLLI